MSTLAPKAAWSSGWMRFGQAGERDAGEDGGAGQGRGVEPGEVLVGGDEAGRHVPLEEAEQAGFQGGLLPLDAVAELGLAVAQLADGVEAGHGGGDQVGVAAEKGGVVVVEGAWFAAVDLQDAEGWFAVRADDDDVGDGADAVVDEGMGGS